MGPAFVLMLREGLEASLIVGILLAYLASIGRKDRARGVLGGAAAAVAASVAIGGLLFLTAAEFEGRAEQVFEGLAAFSAVGVLTWMIFWMRRHAIGLRRSLQEKVAEALESPARFGLAAVAFVVVIREGIETTLFMFATVKQVGAGAATVGGLLGLAVAVALGVGMYRGGVKLNLRAFFTVTGALLLVFAAGLAAHGTAELIEAGIVPAGVEELWNIGHVLSDGQGFGSVLKALAGYNASPALTEVLAWAAYLGLTGAAFFLPLMRVRRKEVSAQGA